MRGRRGQTVWTPMGIGEYTPSCVLPPDAEHTLAHSCCPQSRQSHLDAQSEAWKATRDTSEGAARAQIGALESGRLVLNHSPVISRLCELELVP